VVRHFTETKAGPKTTEFMFMVIFVVGVLVASYIDDNDSLHAEDGWLYAAIAASAYFISRGLAKAGTREPYTDEV
jgi:quinol-cytochrome oxidoreductase complex cytochrome b subunit